MEHWIKSASSYSGTIDHLFWLITVLIGVWFVAVQTALFYCVFRFRRKKGVQAAYLPGNNLKQLAWVLVPVVLVVLCDAWIDVATAKVWTTVKEILPPADAQIRVLGQQWAWTFTHPGPDGKLDTADDIVTVDDLHVEVNKTYHFELQAKDVLHSFSVPVFRLKQDAIPGRTITGWFKPTTTGQFDIQCAEICGVGHSFMVARLTVQSREEHTKWMTPAKTEEPRSVFE